MPPGAPSATDPRVRRLAASVLMPGFVGTAAPDWLRRAVEDGLGGVCLVGANVRDARGHGDVAALTWDLHGIRPDLVVACDEEGGEVTRLEVATGSTWPTHAALGRVDDVGATRAVAAGIGRLCRDRGIDLVLAPDADVTSHPDNRVIGLRSFGRDPALVARHAVAFVDGLQGVGVAGCAKHFPGHGDTRTDSHRTLPVVDADLATLGRRDLVPFDAVVGAGVRAVMTAHVAYPAIDARPATLSADVLEVLRGDLGFSGLVVSDALDMAGLTGWGGRGAAAVAALTAGVDLVCVGHPHHPHHPHHPMPDDDEAAFHEVHDALLAAVTRGDLRVDRLEEAAQRVAELAWWVGENRAAAIDADAGASEADARRSAAHVAATALDHHGVTALALDLHAIDLRDDPPAAVGRGPSGVLAALARARPGLRVHPVGGHRSPDAGGGADAVGAALLSASDGDLVVVVGSPHRSPVAARRLAAVLDARPDALVVATGLPDARDRLGEHWVTTWGDTLGAGAALATLLAP